MVNHILIVEDDTDMCNVIAFFLREEGYQVTQANTGEAAIALLANAPGSDITYDVVLTDIIMGDVDGIEVMNVARGQAYQPEVILLTGHGSLETAISAVRSDAFDYLLKPCDLDELHVCIVNAIRHRTEKQRQFHEAETGRRVAQLVGHLYGWNGETAESPPVAPSKNLPDPSPPVQAISPEANGHSLRTEQASVQEEHPMPPKEPPDRYQQVGLLRIDTYRREVAFNGEAIHVTPTEYGILAYLATMAGRVASFRDIARHVRNYEVDDAEARDLMRGPIRNLRRKFDRRYIVSVRGVGFMLVDPDEEEED